MAKKKKQGVAEEIQSYDLTRLTIPEALLVTEDISDAIKNNFSIRNEKLLLEASGERIEITSGNALIAIAAMLPLCSLDREIRVEDILVLTASDSTSKALSGYWDRIIEEATSVGADMAALKKAIAMSVEALSYYSFAFNEVAGNSINIYDLHQMIVRNPKILDILNMRITENAEYHESVKEVKESHRLMEKYILEDEGNNCYRNLLSSVSPGQFAQIFCGVGYKPEVVSSAIYPHCVNTNLLRGMRNEMDYFVSAMGSRKALITNFSLVRRSGYTSRKLLLLVLNQALSKNIDDCCAEHPLQITVASKDALDRLHGRYRVVTGKKGPIVQVIDRRDQSLIGKEILLRSPMTCEAVDGVCPTCYGRLQEVNPFHIGISGVLNLTEQLTQRLLSSKHLLQINPEKVELSAQMPEYFSVDKTQLVARKNFRIIITQVEKNEDDEVTTKSFTIIDGDRHIEIEFEDGKELFLDPIEESINLYAPENVIDVYEDMEVFRLNVENTELVTPLKKIIRLLESESLLNEFKTDTLLEEMLELLEKSDIRSSSVTIELILRELMRDSTDLQHRPADLGDPDRIVFLKLTNALLHHPSAAITLAFERLVQVVESNIFLKDQNSLIDSLY